MSLHSCKRQVSHPYKTRKLQFCIPSQMTTWKEHIKNIIKQRNHCSPKQKSRTNLSAFGAKYKTVENVDDKKRSKQEERPIPHYCYRNTTITFTCHVEHPITRSSSGWFLRLVMAVRIVWSTVLTSYASGSTAAGRVSQATQVKSDVPDKERHWSSRLRPGHWVDIPIPLNTSLLRGKKKNQNWINSHPDRCSGFRQAMVRNHCEWRKTVLKAKSTTDCIASGGAAEEGRSYPCAVHDNLQMDTKGLDNDSATAKKQNTMHLWNVKAGIYT